MKPDAEQTPEPPKPKPPRRPPQEQQPRPRRWSTAIKILEARLRRMRTE